MSNVNFDKSKVVSPNDGLHYYFGYYDRNPLSACDSLLIAHRINFIDRFPSRGDIVDVGIVDLESSDFRSIKKSDLWNWQLGSCAQWVHRKESGRGVMVNSSLNGGPGAVLVSLDDSKEEIFDRCFYMVSPDSQSFCGFDFARLNRSRPEYGFPLLGEPINGATIPDDDGLWLTDLMTGRHDLAVSYRDLSVLVDSPKKAFHYINHPTYSPDGLKIIFHLRYLESSGLTQSYLIHFDLLSKEIKVLFQGMVSHFSWVGSNAVLVWAGKRKAISSPKNVYLGKVRSSLISALKKVYYVLGRPNRFKAQLLGDSYYELDCDTTIARQVNSMPGCDGHCISSSDGEMYITDTYPENGVIKLYAYIKSADKLKKICEFPYDLKFKDEIRVDLHPRFSSDEQFVVVDTIIDGHRCIEMLCVEGIKP